MKYAIVSLSWNYQITVPVDQLSKFLTMLQSCNRVDSAYVNNKEMYYLIDTPEPLRIVLVDSILDAKPVDSEKTE